ncbi:MAG: glycosyltransferase [Pedobacter sp.]|nr:MAG: glycosyltransferase [Pedobacter sp.]
MKVVVSHPQGNRNVRAIISAFDKRKQLAEFDTTIAVDENSAWLGLLPAALRTELMRRTFPIKSGMIASHPIREIGRMLFPKMGMKTMIRHEEGWACVDQVYRDLDIRVARRLAELVRKQNIRAVYAYEDGALETFTAAKKLGLVCIYDLPIAYWETGRKLMMEEAERLPKWAVTLGGGVKDSAEKLDRKVKEMELADVIVAPGSFVSDSIPAWAKDKEVVISPFGSPLLQGENKNQTSSPLGKLRVLFVGSMGQRKGLGDLIEAIRLLDPNQVELVVMGSLLAPLEFYKEELPGLIYEPGRSHDGVLELMRSCDVFCLPSIVEGRALVMQEAMSQQIPLIITKNTGGSDLIIEGKTGFLVPIQSPENIAAKIQWFLDNREAIPEMGKNAQKHAAAYTWENYSSHVVESINSYLEKI